jgi:hypothetical protein
MQYLEAGGADSGLAGVAANNFGFGRLEVGEEGSPTVVHVLDLFNNGNRGAGNEALYLGDFGSGDGLVLHSGSTLVLNDINVYAWLDGEMKHLNALFGDALIGMEMAGGIVALTAPQAGDYDLNGVVDQGDYDSWRTAYGSASVAADGNRDGVVDAADYSVWRDAFEGSIATLAQQNVAVPEPASLVLILLLAAYPTLARR